MKNRDRIARERREQVRNKSMERLVLIKIWLPGCQDRSVPCEAMVSNEIMEKDPDPLW